MINKNLLISLASELKKNEILHIYMDNGKSITLKKEDSLIHIRNTLMRINKSKYPTLYDFRDNKIIFDLLKVSHIIIAERVE